MTSHDQIRTVAVVGTGLIGSGWAALFLARGLDVVACDPAAGASERLERAIDNAWPALERQGLAANAARSRLRFEPALEAAVGSADFVQENAPEDEAVKTALLATIDACAPADVVVASSSSGLLPTRIQAQCAHPERVVIGHPFNPVYILPLVEVLGGERTSIEAVEIATAFYASLGKHPLRVRKEVEGYVSDRLQEALWREALHMVKEGVATTAEIDAAIIHGPGLRLALMGPCLTFHLAGGEEGMAHMLEQFGPALELPWTKLAAPELTEDLRRRMVEGTAAQAEGTSVAELERLRDDVLLDFLDVLERRRPRAR